MLGRVQRPLRVHAQAALKGSLFRPTVVAASRVVVYSSSIRSFADKVDKPHRSRPPMFGFNGKIAEAAFDDASEEGQVEKVAEELRSFQELFDNDKEFQMEITSPLIRGDQYRPLLEEIYPELGIETESAKNLIAELVTNSSAHKLRKVLDDYDKLAQYAAKKVKARVTSAQPLSDAQVSRLKDVLQKQIDPEETLELEQEVDEGLLGGLKVDMSDRSIDLSVAQRLGELDRALRAS